MVTILRQSSKDKSLYKLEQNFSTYLCVIPSVYILIDKTSNVTRLIA
ncbi:hypothetical protein GCHA_1343 [Paraglaciecola chathamensis S18K6]|uniref:Uncharacterized protein n=2 Tax=Paraglaciecola chathamensis TaxID=368405 RepID=A0ABQ0ICM1_9ALTE|nr:hypothetical protein GAGA_4321 [Paraglaciecola agarilytica NO2]GAC09302.1 hypothetical protein GCHA_1343 [Paraglaciecola chathamensis S18K6]